MIRQPPRYGHEDNFQLPLLTYLLCPVDEGVLYRDRLSNETPHLDQVQDHPTEVLHPHEDRNLNLPVRNSSADGGQLKSVAVLLVDNSRGIEQNWGFGGTFLQRRSSRATLPCHPH